MVLMTLAAVFGVLFVGLSLAVFYSWLGVLLAPVAAAMERPDREAERQLREIERELRRTKRFLRKREGARKAPPRRLLP